MAISDNSAQCSTKRLGSSRVGLGAVLAVALAVPLGLTACTSSKSGSPKVAIWTGGPLSTIISGPECEYLPLGKDPGNPEQLAGGPVDEVVRWVPLLHTFEGLMRAAGLDEKVHGSDGVTILAPTDEAFEEAFSEQTIDDLILFRTDELRPFLEGHIISGKHTLTDLIEAGTVTTLAGTQVKITAADGGMASFDDTARSVCGNYDSTNGRVHLIDHVLGEQPEASPGDDDDDHSHG